MLYFSVNEKSIVNSIMTSPVPIKPKDYDREYIEVPKDIKDVNSIMGKKWNGSTFEEVPIEEVEEPETTEVTNEDLLEVLLAIGEKVGA